MQQEKQNFLTKILHGFKFRIIPIKYTTLAILLEGFKLNIVKYKIYSDNQPYYGLPTENVGVTCICGSSMIDVPIQEKNARIRCQTCYIHGNNCQCKNV